MLVVVLTRRYDMNDVLHKAKLVRQTLKVLVYAQHERLLAKSAKYGSRRAWGETIKQRRRATGQFKVLMLDQILADPNASVVSIDYPFASPMEACVRLFLAPGCEQEQWHWKLSVLTYYLVDGGTHDVQ